MSDRILVTYASEFGSTYGIAQSIARVLYDLGFTVDVLSARTVVSVRPYKGVVVGSPIRSGAWMEEAVEFLKKHRESLEAIPVAFFTVSLTMVEDTPANRETVSGYLKPVRAIIKPHQEGYFAGSLDYRKLNYTAQMILRTDNRPEGDFRDWDAIKEWTESLKPLFAGDKAPR